MRSRLRPSPARLLPLAALLALAACDSGTDEPAPSGNVAGTYAGDATASFADGTTIDYGVRLTLGEPDDMGVAIGPLRIDRGPVGTVSAVTVTGKASAQVSGTTLELTGSAAKAGGGITFEGTATLRDSLLVVSRATFVDYAYGESDGVAITLRR